MPVSVERLFAGTGFAHDQWIPRSVEVPADATALIVVINGDSDLTGRDTVEYLIGGVTIPQIWADPEIHGANRAAVFVLQAPPTGEQTFAHGDPEVMAEWGNLVIYAVRGGTLIETIYGPTEAGTAASGVVPPLTVEGVTEGDAALFVQVAWGDNNTDYTFSDPEGVIVAKLRGTTNASPTSSPPYDEWDAVSLFQGNPLSKTRAQCVGYVIGNGSDDGDVTARFQGVGGFTIDYLVGFRIEADGEPGPESQDIEGSITAPAPSLSGAADHVPPQIEVDGAAVASAPGLSGAMGLELPEHTAAAGLAAPAPRVDGAASQELPTHEAAAGIAAPAPRVAGDAALELPEHEATGSATAPAPRLEGVAVLQVPTHEATGGVAATPARLSGALSLEPTEHTAHGSVSAPAPRVEGALAHEPPVMEATGSLAAPAARIAGVLDHDSGEPIITAALRAPAPRLSGGMGLELPEHAATASFAAPAPLVVGVLEQQDLGAQLVGGLRVRAPRLGGALALELPTHAVSGGLTASRPRVAGVVIQEGDDLLPSPRIVLQAPHRVTLVQAPDRITLR